MTTTPIVHDAITTDQRALASGVQVLQRELCATNPKINQRKRVAAYCRVSTDLEQQASSLETQMSVFNNMIVSQSAWELVNIYVDDGITGTSIKNRVQFKRMIADCEAGRIDYILTKSISRFARNTQDCLNYIKHLKELGVLIYFDDIHLDTGSASSEMLITILAAVAQEESRSLSENMKIGMRMRFKAGKPKWVATYGFVKGEDGKYHINKEQAKGVRRIFELYASGRSLPQIVTQLETEGIPAMHGGKWWPKSLATVLHNEKYIGDVMMQKCYTVDHLTHKKVKNDQTVVPSYYVKDHHESIIDRQTFGRVQTILWMKDKHVGSTQYPYYGTLVCQICGEKMIAFRLSANRHPSVWTCGGHPGNECVKATCPPYVVKTKYIDRAVLEAYRNLDQDALEALAVKANKKAGLAKADMAMADAAQAALRWKKTQPFMKKVEFLFLDELIEKITFSKWHECIITWKFGLISRILVKYDKVSEIPTAELTHTDESHMTNGIKVVAGDQLLRRLKNIHANCTAARGSGDRPKALTTGLPK